MKIAVLLLGILAIAFLAVGSGWLFAEQKPRPPASVPVTPSAASSTPTVGTPVAMPNVIIVNTSTPVTVTVQITDATLIPGSVNLLLVGSTGTQPTILGVMQSAGNGSYSLQPVFDETSTGQIQLEVSAAFRGLLRRVTSSPVQISVWNAISPRNLFTMDIPGTFQITDLTSSNTYDSNVFLFRLNDGTKVGYVYVFTLQQWSAAQEAEEHPLLLIQSGDFVYAYAVSQALYPDEQDETYFLNAVRSLEPL